MTQLEYIADLFVKSATAAQRQYEALRAYFADTMPQHTAAERFGYTCGTVWNLCAEFRKSCELPHAQAQYADRVLLSHPLDHRRSLMEAWHTSIHALGTGQSFDLNFRTIPYHGSDALV